MIPTAQPQNSRYMIAYCRQVIFSDGRGADWYCAVVIQAGSLQVGQLHGQVKLCGCLAVVCSIFWRILLTQPGMDILQVQALQSHLSVRPRQNPPLQSCVVLYSLVRVLFRCQAYVLIPKSFIMRKNRMLWVFWCQSTSVCRLGKYPCLEKLWVSRSFKIFLA